MTEKELLKLKRSEMLEIMLAQSREIDDLRKELEETRAALEDRKIKVRKAGSLAEASLQLTNIFEEAQRAADLYVENIKRRALQREAAQHREKTGKAPAAGKDRSCRHFPGLRGLICQRSACSRAFRASRRGAGRMYSCRARYPLLLYCAEYRKALFGRRIRFLRGRAGKKA